MVSGVAGPAGRSVVTAGALGVVSYVVAASSYGRRRIRPLGSQDQACLLQSQVPSTAVSAAPETISVDGEGGHPQDRLPLGCMCTPANVRSCRESRSWPGRAMTRSSKAAATPPADGGTRGRDLSSGLLAGQGPALYGPWRRGAPPGTGGDAGRHGWRAGSSPDRSLIVCHRVGRYRTYQG